MAIAEDQRIEHDDEEIVTPVYDKSKPWYQAIRPWVFFPAVAIILGFVIFAAVAPDTAGSALGAARGWVIETVGWYYAIVVSAFVVFAIWMAVSHYGDIKLCTDKERDDKPAFNLPTWLSMLFAAGMGIGLVFWGVAEPLNHFAAEDSYPIIGAPADDPAAAAERSLVTTFLHWGLHPWAIYVIVGLAVAYAVHVKRRPISLRWTVEPLFGKRLLKGFTGNIIDVIAVVGTLFGVATSLGFGVMQIARGMELVEITSSTSPLALLYLILIGCITLVAIFSVVSGVEKGIKWLSNVNMSMAIGLLAFVFIAGPTLYFIRQYIEGIGSYLASILTMSFNTAATTGSAGIDWSGAWTGFYWGWWISWAPFVGVFIARISKGRTVREFVLGVLLVPSLFSILWFTVLGGGALQNELNGDGGLIGEDGGVDTEGVLFSFLDILAPGTIGYVVSLLTILLIALFFITSSDTGSLVLDMLSSGGMVEPPTWSRVMWSVIEGLAAAALLLAGLAAFSEREAGQSALGALFAVTPETLPEGGDSALNALQDMAIIIAFPFSLIMVLMCIAMVREFRQFRGLALRAQRRANREQLANEVAETLAEDGMVAAAPARAKAPSRRRSRGKGQ